MKRLHVPEHIALRWELMPGFGKPELIRSLIVTAITLCGAALYCVCSASPMKAVYAAIAVVVELFLCVGLFSKLDGATSIYDYLTRGRRYRKEQQTFLYCYGKEKIIIAQEEEQDH